MAADAQTELNTAVAVLPANAPDSERALEFVEASEVNGGAEVEEAIGDCSYGDSTTRAIFEQRGRKLVARVPCPRNQGDFPKEAFRIDLEAGTCTCPAGEVTPTTVPCGMRKDRTGRAFCVRAFQFEAEVPHRCPLREACTRARPGKGRTVRFHPQERLLQAAHALQASPEFEDYGRKRQAADHRLARLVQLGTRKSRSFGQGKTLFQVLLAATVANLTLTAGKTNKMGGGSREKALLSFLLSVLERLIQAIGIGGLRRRLRVRALLPLPQPAFRPDF